MSVNQLIASGPELQEIANICLLNGGPSVSAARAINNFNFANRVVYYDQCESNPLRESERLKESENSVEIYPNPNNGTFEIVWSNKKICLEGLKIFSSTGMLIDNQKVIAKEGTFTTDYKYLNEGLFTIGLSFDNSDLVLKKLIIVK